MTPIFQEASTLHPRPSGTPCGGGRGRRGEGPAVHLVKPGDLYPWTHVIFLHT